MYKPTTIPIPPVSIGLFAQVLFVVASIAFLAGLVSHLNEASRMVDFVSKKSDDRWTATHMEAWVAELKRTNPSISVPPAKK